MAASNVGTVSANQEISIKPPPPLPQAESAALTSGVVGMMDFTERSKPVITLETHYNELVRMIAEIGKDIKPAYTNSRISTERLRKNIMVARGVVRECFTDLDRLSNS